MYITSKYSNPTNLVPTDVATLAIAKKTIDFAAYSLTESQVIAQLAASARAGVAVRLYLDRTELASEARGNPLMTGKPLADILNVPGISIKVKASSILMHLKSYCVDGQILRDGSANFSPEGELEQDNSITIITDEQTISNFQAKFDAMWARADNQTTLQAISEEHRNPSPHVHQR